MTIGKISIGVNSKREFHDLTHDVNTSADFGFAQPTLIQSVMPDSKIDISTKSFVRLSALPCPTFGRIQVKQETVFVPIREVFEAFDIMMSGNTVSSIGLGGSYSPKQADMMYSGQLLDFLMSEPHMALGYSSDSFTTDNVNNIFRMFFRMGYYANYDPADGTLSSEWHDLCDDSHVSNFINFLKNNNSAPFGADDDAASDTFVDRFGTFLLDTDEESAYSLFTRAWINDANLQGYTFAHCFVGYDQLNKIDLTVPNDLQVAYSNMDSAFAHVFNMKSTPENADFYVHFVPRNKVKYEGLAVNTYSDNTDGLGVHLITFTLTPFGRRFFKVLNSMGVTFGCNNSKIEINKLFAYYKAWFDLYNPNRVLQWKDTAAYRLIHQYYDYYYSLREAFEDAVNASLNDRTESVIADFRQLVLDVSKCVYYLDADPITVATPTNLINPQGEFSPALDYLNNGVQGNVTGITSVAGQYPRTGAIGNFTGLSGLTIKMLEKFYYLANKESVLASNIADFMLSRYGVDIRSTRRLGSDEFYCQISDVMGTVNNEQTALGEYAGKGIGAGDTKKIEFEVKEQGYIIQLTSVVPFGGYVQAATFPQIGKNDFFVPEFDSVGLEALPYSQVFSRESGLNNFKPDSTFGFRPYYFSLKYRNNVANGDFSFRSTRSQVLPYSLDRLFSEGELAGLDIQQGAYIPALIKDSKPIRLTPTEELRSIGLYESFGNYDRIFYDVTGITDNFLIHMIQDIAYYAPMKPIRKSYDTFDPESDDDVKNVEHA